MESIHMVFMREGEDEGALIKGHLYHVAIESSQHRQFHMPLSYEEFRRRLSRLRYHKLVSAEERKQALSEISEQVTKVLVPPAVAAGSEPLQLDLVTNARELWALPFEAALTPDGEPLFAGSGGCFQLARRFSISSSLRSATRVLRSSFMKSSPSPRFSTMPSRRV